MTITIPEALDIGRYALMTALAMAAPVLLVGMVMGLAVSLFQAVTQIQEQTLSFVPKMLAMGLAVILFMPWISMRLMEFAKAMFHSILPG